MDRLVKLGSQADGNAFRVGLVWGGQPPPVFQLRKGGNHDNLEHSQRHQVGRKGHQYGLKVCVCKVAGLLENLDGKPLHTRVETIC